MPLRSDIDAIDRPTVLYVIYSMGTIGKLSITAESHISDIDLSRKWRRYGSFFGLYTQKGSSVAHSPSNILYVAWQVGP